MGTVVTADCTRYRFEDRNNSHYGSTGFPDSAELRKYTHAELVTDRHGNRVAIAYQTSPYLSVVYTNQLGRTTRVGFGAPNPATAARGNATTVRRWLDAPNSWVETHAQYDQLGQLRFSWDASGGRSEIRYNDSFSDGVNTCNTYAFPTATLSAVPDPSGQNGMNTALASLAVYDFSTGLGTSTTDANSKTTSFEYNDPFHRTVRVVEDPAGLAYATDYAYDALGRLRRVEQGGQLRFFMYDSLGRLTRVRQPEQSTNPSLALADPTTGNSQWSLAYSYDADGRIVSRTDARGVTTTYGYDALGRSTRVDHSDTTQSPDVERRYDGATNGRGRPWHDSAYSQGGAEAEHSVVDAYDSMGRALNRRQHFLEGGQWSAAYNVQYVYNLAGGTTSVTYPSGRSVVYSYDGAGRLSTFTGNLGDSQTRTYASETKYDEAGRLRQERFGTQTPVYSKSFYNVRGQLAEIRIGTTPDDTGWSRGAIINHFSNASGAWGATGGGPDNSGNLKRQDVFVPRDEANTAHDVYSQFYEYDSLNRLTSAREQLNGGAVAWRQQYEYDRFGNRTVNQAGTWGGVPEMYCTASATTNHLGVPAGQYGAMQYDAAGNITNDTYTGASARTYDAENRMISAQDYAGQVRVTPTTRRARARAARWAGGRRGRSTARRASFWPSTPPGRRPRRRRRSTATARASCP